MNVAPFVIDIGTNYIKHELGGTDEPNLLRTEVGFEKYSRSSSTTSTITTTKDGQKIMGSMQLLPQGGPAALLF